MRHGKPREFGSVIAYIDVYNDEEAVLLMNALTDAMRKLPEGPESSVLVQWYNRLVKARAKASAEKWLGWKE